MNTIHKWKSLVHRHRCRCLVRDQHKFFNEFLRLTASSWENIFYTAIFNEEFAFAGFDVHGTTFKSALVQHSRQLFHFFDFRKEFAVFRHNLLGSSTAKDSIDFAVNTFDTGTNIALRKAITNQLAFFIESQQSREGQTHLIRIQGTNAVGQFLWQHRDNLICIVHGSSSCISFVIQC